MTRILTLETLIAKGACLSSQEKFSELFLNGAPLTVQTFVDVANQFDWLCAARLLLSPRNQIRFRELVAAAAFAATRAPDSATYVAARTTFNAASAAAFATLYIQQLEVDFKP